MKMTIHKPFYEYRYEMNEEKRLVIRYSGNVAIARRELEELKGKWFVNAERKKCLALIEMYEGFIEESKKKIEELKPLVEEEEKRLEKQKKAYEDNLKMVEFCKKYHEEHPHKARRCRKKF